MKFKLAVLAFILIVSVQGQSLAADDNRAFRRADWGMSLEEVRASEEAQSDSVGYKKPEPAKGKRQAGRNEKPSLWYHVDMFGSKALVVYYFDQNGPRKDRLSSVMVSVFAPALGQPDLPGTYAAFSALLTEKYGAPVKLGRSALGLEWQTPAKTINATFSKEMDNKLSEMVVLLYTPRGDGKALPADLEKYMGNF